MNAAHGRTLWLRIVDAFLRWAKEAKGSELIDTALLMPLRGASAQPRGPSPRRQGRTPDAQAG